MVQEARIPPGGSLVREARRRGMAVAPTPPGPDGTPAAPPCRSAKTLVGVPGIRRRVADVAESSCGSRPPPTLPEVGHTPPLEIPRDPG